MPQINFTNAFGEENAAATPPVFESQTTSAPPVFGGPSRFPATGLARSERVNILFAGIAIAGGLFCAFYFFHGSELVRTALFWPGEVVYSRPVATASHLEVASNAPAETALPGSPLERRSSETDRSGDPFSRAHKLISLDRPLGSRGRGGGLTAGNPPSFLPPPVLGLPAPPGTPGLPGGSVGGLPGPGTLISRLTLLRPGGDALTHALRTGAARVTGKLVVNMRHDVRRGRTIPRRIVRCVFVRPSIAVANRRASAGNRKRNINRGVIGTGSQAQQKISSSFGTGRGAPERMNSGSGAVSTGTSTGASGGRIGSAVGGVTGGLRGKVGGALGGVGGAVRGAVGGVGGLVGGGGRR